MVRYGPKKDNFKKLMFTIFLLYPKAKLYLMVHMT